MPTGLAREGRLTEGGLHLYLLDLFASRQIEPFVRLIGDAGIGHQDVRLFHRIRLDHYRGIAPIGEDELRPFIARAKANAVLRLATLGLAVEQAVRDENVALTLELFAETSPDELKSIPLTGRVGALRLLVKHGRLAEARGLLTRFLAGIDDEARLYYLEIGQAILAGEAPAVFGLTEGLDWRQVLKRQMETYSAADEEDRQTFRRIVADTLERIPEGERDLMDVRFSAEQRERLLRLVGDRLSAGRPLSLVRLGDGEAYAFDAPSIPRVDPAQFEEDDLVRERHWWGSALPRDRRAAIKAAVQAAVAAGDVLGIPSIYRIIRDRGPRGMRFGRSRAHRGLAVVLNAVAQKVDLGRCLATEERCHQVVFGRKEVERLSAMAARTVVVGCWSRSQLDIDLGERATFVIIPAATKVKDSAAPPSTEASLPYVFEEIADRVAALSGPGTLVLVAAGLLGKVFVHHAQRAGAVALDVGSIFDYSAGFKTRNISDVV